MVYIYIATVVVMLGLILFTSLAILTISKTTCQNIKKKTMELTSLYDYLLEEYSQELKNKKRLIAQLGLERVTPVAQPEVELQVQVNQTQATSSVSTLQTLEKINKARYQTPALVENYQEIRDHFSVDLAQVLEKIPALKQAQTPSLAAQLLALLSYETTYSMSFLTQEEQLVCMQESISKKHKPVLDAFLQQTESFSSLAFYTYLQEQAEAQNTQAVIYVSPNVEIKDAGSLRVEVKEDICEGIQVEVNHLFYDFAIEKKEIG